MSRIRLAILILVLAHSLPPCVRGAEDTARQQVAAMPEFRTVAILPFANYTGLLQAQSIVVPRFYSAIQSHGLLPVDPAEIRPILRKHRIRVAGNISSEGARLLQEELGVQYVCLGSLDFYDTTGLPEIGVSARLIDPSSMRIVWAASRSANGKDYIGLLQFGLIENMEELIDRILSEMMKDLDINTLDQSHANYKEYPAVAIVPLNNYSDNSRAGYICSSILLAQLHALRLAVVEPGVAEEIFVENRTRPSGAIDLKTLEALYDAVQPAVVFTGAVDDFKLARADLVGQTVPEVNISLRAMDGRTGEMIAWYNDWRTGADSRTVFGLGEQHALGNLTGGLIAHILKDFVEKKGGRLAQSD